VNSRPNIDVGQLWEFNAPHREPSTYTIIGVDGQKTVDLLCSTGEIIVGYDCSFIQDPAFWNRIS
jgi:hypothetical protein